MGACGIITAHPTRGNKLTDSAAPIRLLPWGIALFAVGVSTGVLLNQPAPQSTPPPPSWTSYAEVYDAVAPVVVNVSVESPEQRVGSGFAVSATQIVTARHLVLDASHATVRMMDGRSVVARVVGTDSRTDLALLQADEIRMAPARLGRSADLAIGDTVLAVGNPYGLGHSLAVGILGSRGRQLESDGRQDPVDFLQLTIPLNPGNSGGAIFDAGGRVIGVLAGTHAQGQAIAFATPVEALSEVLPRLEHGVQLTRSYLGLSTEMDTGRVVASSVIPSGPAGMAGVLAGDVLVRLDGVTVEGPEQLRALLDKHPPGRAVELELDRAGIPLSVAVVLGDWSQTTIVVAGMTLRPEPGAGGRVLAVRPRSRAAAAGVVENDVVHAVDGVPVRAPAEVQEMLRGALRQVEVVRAGVPITVTFND